MGCCSAWRGGSRALPRGLAAFVLTFTLVFALVLAAGAAALPTRHIDRGEFNPSASDAIPLAGWQAVRLPRLYRVPHGSGPGQCWYRLRLTLSEVPVEPPALYIASMNRSARIYVDGAMLTTLGSFDDPMPMNWNRAQP